MRNERKDFIIEPTEIKRLVMEYYEQLYVNKLENLHEVEKLPERPKFPKITQEKINRGA